MPDIAPHPTMPILVFFMVIAPLIEIFACMQAFFFLEKYMTLCVFLQVAAFDGGSFLQRLKPRGRCPLRPLWGLCPSTPHRALP